MHHKKFLVQIVPASLVFSLLLSAEIAVAQNISKIQYASVTLVGLQSGELGEALILQTINGIKKDKWFAGAGAGLDFYGYRSVPLFLDIRRDLSASKNTPFAYADGGINFLWFSAVQKQQLPSVSSSPGLYYDLGVGWKLSGKNNRGFIVSAGYAFKQVKYKIPSYNPAPIPELQSENFDRYNLLYRRVVVKVGFEL